MPTAIYPAIIYPADADGLHGVVIPGVNVNASGATETEAVADAAAILQELIDDLGASGEAVPPPVPVEEIDFDGGAKGFIMATLPGRSVRVNVTLPEGLLKRIDAASSNRSAFLAEGALSRLRDMD